MSEPAPRRPTGVGWPDAPPPASPPPASPPPPPPRPTPGAELPRPTQRYRAPHDRTPTAPRRPIELPPERPGTVTAAAVILFVAAGLGLLACCGINLLAGQTDLRGAEQNLVMLLSALFAVTSLGNLLLGYFILQGRQWARITTIVLCAIGIAGSLVSLVVAAGSDAGSGGGSGGGTCVGIILNVVIIGLLSGSSAAEYFRYARG